MKFYVKYSETLLTTFGTTFLVLNDFTLLILIPTLFASKL